MKTSLIALVLISAVVLISPASASAATNAGIKPGSFWYSFDLAFEKINLFFTFNSESKARKALEYADERLAEVEAVAENNNTDAVKTAIAGYENNIALAVEESKQVKDKGKVEGLLTSIVDNISKHQEILSDVLSKVPDEAKDAITKAIEASRRGQEEATKQTAELKGEVEQMKKEVTELQQKEVGTSSNNQAVELEKLKKEIEELKKKPTPVPVFVAPKPTTSPTTPSSNLSSLIPQPYVAPPTTEQLRKIRRVCLLDENAPICTDENFMPGYISNFTFRTLMDPLINQALTLLEARKSQQFAAEIKTLDCLMAPTPEDERVLDPATQNYLRQVRCGTVTDADRTNYELSRIKSSVDELKYRLETKISFPPVLFDTLKPTDWWNRWEIRWDGFGGGTIKDSTGGFYQFRCETNYCVSY